jgi:hypothetical protein
MAINGRFGITCFEWLSCRRRMAVTEVRQYFAIGAKERYILYRTFGSDWTAPMILMHWPDQRMRTFAVPAVSDLSARSSRR